ncbi:MAG TPA: transcription elongation factor GreA [bacterium]|nr:transcription elongation factor GreA [bacterium]HPN44841.1 transcription elongation factor GreA [bacterium]
MKAMYLSQEQFDKLKSELDHLKRVERKKAIQAIAEAREHGDLKENAEYAAAKEKQSLVEGKILRLEEMLSRARIMTEEMQSNSRVMVGSRVKLIDIKYDEELEYELVPTADFNLSDMEAISVDSPVGKALIGKQVGEMVEIKVPAGTIQYKVLEIQ